MGATAAVPVTFRLDEVLKARAAKRKPMSQSELSRLSGVSLTTINAMMHNNTRQVSLDTLDKICGALAIEPGALLKREDPEQRAKNKRRGR